MSRPKRPKKPQLSPYLKGVPQLSDRLARMATKRYLSEAQEAELESQVTLLKQMIREALEAWEAVHGPS